MALERIVDEFLESGISVGVSSSGYDPFRIGRRRTFAGMRDLLNLEELSINFGTLARGPAIAGLFSSLTKLILGDIDIVLVLSSVEPARPFYVRSLRS